MISDDMLQEGGIDTCQVSTCKYKQTVIIYYYSHLLYIIIYIGWFWRTNSEY